MPFIHFSLGAVSNHDNMNAVPAIDTVIPAGSVINSLGDIVSGVSFSLAANPFLLVSSPFDGGNAFPQVNETAQYRSLNLNAGEADAEAVVGGLPASTAIVSLFGARDSASSAPALMSLNGRTGIPYNASNAGTYEDHLAVDTITLDGSTDLAINISHTTGQGTYAYSNLITIEYTLANQPPETIKPVIASTTPNPIVLGQPFTITGDGSLDLTLYSSVVAVYGGVNLGEGTSITSNTAAFDAPSQGLEPGANHDLILRVK